ncbi:MAG: hypothetical protein H7Y06_04920 [Opitutaceae bacterium]|nr:hypothetical protein [Opitutaceae bacterium]
MDTSLVSLAQNLEGREWPLRGPDEKPSFYIELDFDQLLGQLAMSGQPPAQADHLIDILKETLAFDDPFGDMIVQSEAVAVAENPLVKNLAKLKIPGEFPVTLTTLSPETLAFCKLENLSTLGEFAFSAQRMASSVVVGGDFRALLNALSHVDERTLARFIPFRIGEKGLHYIEGLAQAVSSQPAAIQAALAKRVMQTLPKTTQELAGTVSPEALAAAQTAISLRSTILRLHCGEEYTAMMKDIASGANPRTMVAVLADPVIEAVVADILKPETAKPREGFFARLFGRGNK